MEKTRRSHWVRDLAITLLLLSVGLVLVGAWRGGLPGGSSTPTHAPTTPASVHPDVEAPAQPAADGYEHLVTEERYVLVQDDGKTEIQQRRRESWRATDGWTWARQTGSDPGSFIFEPDTDWKVVRRAKPDAAALKQVMRATVTGAPSAKVVNAEFNFVSGLLGVESLPAGSLPTNYREALIAPLAMNDEIAVTRHVQDPLGRDSTRITLTDSDDPNLTQSLFLDRGYRYLAYTAAVKGSAERGSRVITKRDHVDKIPADLLVALGSERVAKAIWK